MGVPVWTEEGGYVTGFSTELQEEGMNVTPEKRAIFLLKIPNISFNPGVYVSNFAIHDGPECLYRSMNSNLKILPCRHIYWGAVTLPHKWEIYEASDK